MVKNSGTQGRGRHGGSGGGGEIEGGGGRGGIEIEKLEVESKVAVKKVVEVERAESASRSETRC